jgi:hypothetical protein
VADDALVDQLKFAVAAGAVDGARVPDLSPTWNRVASGPTAVTTPAASQPSTSGWPSFGARFLRTLVSTD